jgi:hypothetical protein
VTFLNKAAGLDPGTIIPVTVTRASTYDLEAEPAVDALRTAAEIPSRHPARSEASRVGRVD